MNRNGPDEWVEFLGEKLDRLSSTHRYRSLQNENSSYLDFSSSDYLSFVRDGVLSNQLLESVKQFPATGATGSRLISGHHSNFDRAEETFAEYAGWKESLYFSSGYAANTGTISALLGPGDLALMDRLCHASILDGVRLSGAKKFFFKHNDMVSLEKRLQAALENNSIKRIWVFTESIFSMDGDEGELVKLSAIVKKYGALLYVDEAHAMGLYGPGGAGLLRENNLLSHVTVAVYPLGKAPGLGGAFVAGSGRLKEYLINHARSFIFSTSLPPFWADLLCALPEALAGEGALFRRKQLFKNAGRMRKGLLQRGFKIPPGNSAIIPVILGDNQLVMNFGQGLKERGILGAPVRAPSVPLGEERLRLIAHASHSEEEIDFLLDSLTRIRETAMG